MKAWSPLLLILLFSFVINNGFSQLTIDYGGGLNNVNRVENATDITYSVTASPANLDYLGPDGLFTALASGKTVTINNAFGDANFGHGFNPNSGNLILNNTNGSITLLSTTAQSAQLHLTFAASGDIIKGDGPLITLGGDIDFTGDNILFDNVGNITAFDIDLVATNNVSFTMTGSISSTGLNSSGVDFTVDLFGTINTQSGDINILHTGNVFFNLTALTGGGFTSRGNEFTFQSADADFEGAVFIEHLGDVTYGPAADMNSDGDNIFINSCMGSVDINSELNSNGGSISVFAPNGSITLDGELNTSGGGSLGQLIQNGDDIFVNVSPNVEGGDVVLSTELIDSEYCLTTVPIPTLGQWGLILLTLILMIAGIMAIKPQFKVV